jgi:hypothetical protein
MREQFMRIAMARLRSTYPFKPQRRAVAAKMWAQHLERHGMREWMRLQQEIAQVVFYNPCEAHAAQQEWEIQEEELNKRMDIIGSNGNEGEHYE